MIFPLPSKDENFSFFTDNVDIYNVIYLMIIQKVMTLISITNASDGITYIINN